MRVGAVLVLCAIGAVVAVLLLRPASPPPPLPPLQTVALDSSDLERALGERASALRAERAIASGTVDELLTQDPLDLSIPELTRSGVSLRDVTVRRDGSRAVAEATVDPAQLAALAPAEVSNLRLDAPASRDGALVFTGVARALGFSLPVTVRVQVRDGAVIAEPDGIPIGRIVLFDDPRVRVSTLHATAVDGGLRVRAVGSVSPPSGASAQQP